MRIFDIAGRSYLELLHAEGAIAIKITHISFIERYPITTQPNASRLCIFNGEKIVVYDSYDSIVQILETAEIAKKARRVRIPE